MLLTCRSSHLAVDSRHWWVSSQCFSTFGRHQADGSDDLHAGFPLIIIVLIPLRTHYGPKWFTPAELAILDAPTANSAAVMVSIGSDLARVTGEGKEVAEDTGIAGTLARGEDGEEDRLAAYRVRSRQEEQDAHINNVTSIRR